MNLESWLITALPFVVNPFYAPLLCSFLSLKSTEPISYLDIKKYLRRRKEIHKLKSQHIKQSLITQFDLWNNQQGHK